MQARRALWLSWICLLLGLCAAIPYPLYFARQLGRWQQFVLTPGLLLVNGLTFGFLAVTAGAVSLADRPRVAAAALVVSVLGIVLGVAGLFADVYMFIHLLSG